MRAVAILLCLLMCLAPAVAWPQSPWLAVVGGTVIDGTGRPPQPNTTVLIDDEHIFAVGPADEVDVPTEARILDATGKWIIPGLIDAHIHFFQSGDIYARPDIMDLRDVKPYAQEIEKVRENLPQTFARYIASGVTSVIDAGGPFWTFDVRALAERIPRAPRVAVTGPLLSSGAPQKLQDLDDPPIIPVATPEEGRAAVDRLLAYKPDSIKIWLVSGKRDLETEMAWVRAVIAAARAADVPVMVHATERAMARAVVAAGADILTHSIRDRPIDDGLLAMMRDNKVVYTTSLVVDESYRQVFGGRVEFLDIERRLGNPAAIGSLMRQNAGTLDLVAPEQPQAAALRGPDPMAADNLRRVLARGITIAAASDAGNIGTLHGPALHRELELTVEAGLTPMQALTAATRGGASAMRRLDELGSLEAGKLADLVVLDRDPLADISNTQAIYRVVKGGQIFDPDEIAAELRKNKQDP